MERLPVLRPDLPNADRLLPYLRSIDASRIYSNHGPLASTLERRLSDRLGLPAGGIVCASSGTSAIIGAVLAAAGRAHEERPFALIPAFTFVATALAIEQCGYRPYLADVDPDSWLLDPEKLLLHPQLKRFGVVVPVAPYGRPVPQEPWQTFRLRTNIPVVIDGGASFDTSLQEPDRYIGDVPVALSFHATKCFSTGEGGAIASSDLTIVGRSMQALNFGFRTMRDSQMASTNGKLSEYHAAVGLAELDGWLDKQSSLLTVVNLYRRLMDRESISPSFYAAPDISKSYALFLCSSLDEAAEVTGSLDRHQIDCRLWYGTGVQGHTYFSAVCHDGLNISESLASRLIGLPISSDLTEGDVCRVVRALREGVRASALRQNYVGNRPPSGDP